jgi:hypothetical protein
METKKCCKCQLEKTVNHFIKQKSSNDGYYCVCKDCKKEYDKNYRAANKLKISKAKKNHYEINKEKTLNRINQYHKLNQTSIKEYQKEYRLKNKEKNKEYQKKYRELNKSTRNIKEKERKNNDILYKLKTHLRTMISNSFKRKGYSKSSKTFQILGCSYEEFKQHLEAKFEPWMTWENRGLYNGEPNYGWDIDHIIPLDTATCEGDIIRLNHYTNLQPLCSYYNRDIKINKHRAF